MPPIPFQLLPDARIRYDAQQAIWGAKALQQPGAFLPRPPLPPR